MIWSGLLILTDNEGYYDFPSLQLTRPASEWIGNLPLINGKTVAFWAQVSPPAWGAPSAQKIMAWFVTNIGESAWSWRSSCSP
jgi:hypothetical protein